MKEITLFYIEFQQDIMKIVALTDIHGSYHTAEKILVKEQPDVVIIGGDLTNVGSVKEVEQTIKHFQNITSRMLCVAGNMDLPQHDELYVRLGVSINGIGHSIDNVGFFGCSASPHSPLHTPYEISEEEITRRLDAGFSQIKQAPMKIAVPHAPPYGTKVDIVHAGYHVGSTAVRDFLELRKPDVCICGHIHEARGQDKLEHTNVINCGPCGKGFYGLILIESGISIFNKQLTENPAL
jgi:hypothetical protein